MSRIRIDVWREDGSVTRLEGSAGVAVVMPEYSLPQKELSPLEVMRELGDRLPMLAVRCDNPRELALCMAAIQSFANVHGGGASTALFATMLSVLMDSHAPEYRRALPEDKP